MMEMVTRDEHFIQNILFTDELSFALHGKPNSSVMRYWSEENQHRSIPVRSQYPQKLNVWAGIVGHHVVGPFFIDGTLNTQKYLELLDDQVLPAIRALPGMNLNRVWFQQDGCPVHNAREVREFLGNTFPGRVIAGYGNIRWPARSPDLSPLDFFLWGYLKQKIYSHNRPENLQELRVNIEELARNIPPDMLANTLENFYHRLECCLQKQGGIFEPSL